ncbi:MAG: LD-carboxypeptidase [Bacteroidetes bacterium]|nr:LD-carboxypeptidase [Bacteroidota bacterium]
MKSVKPPFLQPGDCIGLTCPAGFLDPNKSVACIHTLQQWGYEVMVGKTVHSTSHNYFSGTDEERRDELQAMLNNKQIKAIIFGRGGYGMSRILDGLSFNKFLQYPKWLAGFSDITVMHNHLLTNFGVASIHASMAAEFEKKPSVNSNIITLRDALEGIPASYQISPHSMNVAGEARGLLVGGNLALLAHIIGTKSDFDTRNKILFMEDVGEYLYNIDRMLNQLLRAGKFKKPAAILIGNFSDTKDTTRPYGKKVYEIIGEYTARIGCPVVFDFPVGHTDRNLALKHGANYHLKVEKKNVRLMEIF